MPLYAVAARGRCVGGVYETWGEAQQDVAGVPGARYKKFGTRDECLAFIAANSEPGRGVLHAPPAPAAGPSRPPAVAGGLHRPIGPPPVPTSGAAGAGGARPPPVAGGEHYALYFDGGARGNPGRGGAGAVVYRGGALVYTAGVYMAHATNNEAEYTGLLTGLRWAAGRSPPVASFTVHGDSQLVIKQMRGEYRVHAGNLLALHAEARKLASAIPRVTYTHVYREQNAAADAAGNRACDERRDFATHAGVPVPLPSALGKRGREEEEEEDPR